MSDTPLISLLHATRNRPMQALATRKAWIESAANPGMVEHVFACQDDDQQSRRLPNVVTTPSPPDWASSSVDNWNEAARVSRGDILVVIADDLFPFNRWDEALARVHETANHEPYVAQMPDNLAGCDGLIRHPVMNRKLYDKHGFIFHPEFWGVYCDNHLSALCHNQVTVLRLEYLKGWIHKHPIGKESKWDSVTALQNSGKAYQYGNAVFKAFVDHKNAYRFADPVNAVWVGGDIGVMERLTLQLLSNHGHRVNLYTDRKHKGLPSGVTCRKIDPGFPEPVGFQGKPHPSIPNGGIGSYAHWSDLFAWWTLHHQGGAWIQMDVAALQPLKVPDYTFTPHNGGIAPVCFTLPKGSKLALRVFEELYDHTLNGWKNDDWHLSMKVQTEVAKRMKIPAKGFASFHDAGFSGPTLFNRPAKQTPSLIHWSNATHGLDKNDPPKEGLYYALCRDAGLI